MQNNILGGTVHKLPKDLSKELSSHKETLFTWNDITPLARNEWICWIENAKLIETRKHRIKRAYNELAQNKRRPCCWGGCPHREKNKS